MRSSSPFLTISGWLASMMKYFVSLFCQYNCSIFRENLEEMILQNYINRDVCKKIEYMTHVMKEFAKKYFQDYVFNLKQFFLFISSLWYPVFQK